MSIPPLVCSTPPPPEQCEDDKDTEDFDLSYNLSQEEDDDDVNNDYNYGNFSSYSHYQPSPNNKPHEIKEHEITKSVDDEVHKEVFIEYGNSTQTEQSNSSQDVFGASDINENKLKCDEDTNIEDLNLKLDEEIVTIIEDNGDEHETSEQNADSFKDLNIPCSSNNSSQGTNVSSCENVNEPIEGSKETQIDLEEEIVERFSEVTVKFESNANPVDIALSEHMDAASSIQFVDPPRLGDLSKDSEEHTDEFKQPPQELSTVTNDINIDDDFGDFDDFKFVNTKTDVATVVDSSNPWENAETNESDFGNFTANFDENQFRSVETPQNTIPISDTDQAVREIKDEESNLDSDFEDFEDFKSSAVKSGANVAPEEECQLHFLNLQSTDNEHQIMESISKVLSSVFQEEISNTNVETECKLESLLSETWGHLMQTDERQPYIVNWNNSLGQKTLLKALCIDSRNILFGPKWSSHMPKYAANLSNAPLQPQKQPSAPSNASVSEVVADKTVNKQTTWSDPFTSDGQESCNSENDGANITPRPTDLDVFEAATSSKSDKIYSNTIGVQPMRQISLPDTHIFTPTDSEIPRSKTIHYDRSPGVLLPQPALDENNAQTDNSATQNANSVPEAGSDNTNEYWEFQDFKSTINTSLPVSINQSEIPQENKMEIATTLPIANVAYQTNLLQPIKVEPSMPTLNWPDPGEVKVAYDDFSDFVSISSQSTEKQGIAEPSLPQIDADNIIKPENLNDLNEKTDDITDTVIVKNDDIVDDDFDTFQSALPTSSAPNDFKTAFGFTANQTVDDFTDVQNGSPKNNNNKSDNISSAALQRPSDQALTPNVGFISNTTEFPYKNSLSVGPQIQPSLLQPTPASFSATNTQNQRTTGQILQPLFLESYSQINWPSPGIDLQDLSRFNPVETLHSLKSDLSVSGLSKGSSPVHNQKTTTVNQSSDDDVWGEFVSSKPKQQQSHSKITPVFAEDDEWTDFISSPSAKPQNGLNTISFNVHTNSNIQKTSQNKFSVKSKQTPVDIPTLNYITPKSNTHKSYNDKHFQNL
ncbi:uncharacterized protein LOC113504835 isoform X2 [Trichoplusia ni]|uniref:Uncharacterized protein LOC113504835 isoform X2 n=1 Tax=Trichoplusia ni TaxID=7111 RepID=A0A7E5WQR7_TRINI|nr:uncharacterized protein LOC113504835 isoform X2 [Trichoplusia ni]